MRTGSAKPDTPTITLFGAIIFLLVMFLGGAATLWGPIVGAVAYVWVDDATCKAGTEKEGVVGWLFGWANQSPATMILGRGHHRRGVRRAPWHRRADQTADRKIVVVVPEHVGTSAPPSPAPAGDVVPQATT